MTSGGWRSRVLTPSDGIDARRGPASRTASSIAGAWGVSAPRRRSFSTSTGPNHVVRTVNPLQDRMTALQADVTSSGVTEIRELVLVAPVRLGADDGDARAVAPGLERAALRRG